MNRSLEPDELKMMMEGRTVMQVASSGGYAQGQAVRK